MRNLPIKKQISMQLWHDIDLKLTGENFDSNLTAQLAQDMRKALTDSPWYDPQGSNLAKIQIAGEVQFYRERERSKLYHQYTTREPYTDYEDETRTRDIPYTDFETHMRGDGSFETIPVQKTRTETYTERVPVKRYRDVPHVFEFVGWRYTQNSKLVYMAKWPLVTYRCRYSLSVNLHKPKWRTMYQRRILD